MAVYCNINLFPLFYLLCRVKVMVLVMMGLPLVLKFLNLRHPWADLFSL